MRTRSHSAKKLQVSKYWKPLYCLHNLRLAQSPGITWDNLSIEISPGKTCASSCRRKPNADNAVFSVPASRARSKARQRWAVWESMRVVGVSKGNTYAVAVRHPPKCWSGPSKIVEYILCGVYRKNFTAEGTTYCQSDKYCFFSIWILWSPFSIGIFTPPPVWESHSLWLLMQFWRRYSPGLDAQAA